MADEKRAFYCPHWEASGRELVVKLGEPEPPEVCSRRDLVEARAILDEIERLTWREGSTLADAVDIIHDIRKLARPDGKQTELTASEALYGFMGWLSTRRVPTVAGAEHDAAGLADLIKTFCDTNDLTEPREGWQRRLRHPDG